MPQQTNSDSPEEYPRAKSKCSCKSIPYTKFPPILTCNIVRLHYLPTGEVFLYGKMLAAL